jgi:hypothetical protein
MIERFEALSLHLALSALFPDPRLADYCELIWPRMPFLDRYSFSWAPMTFGLPLDELRSVFSHSSRSSVLLLSHIFLDCLLHILLSFQVFLNKLLAEHS